MFRADQMTTDVWDYIFFGGDIPSSTDIPHDALQ